MIYLKIFVCASGTHVVNDGYKDIFCCLPRFEGYDAILCPNKILSVEG